jgi:glycosyltransferase involved in cell wall biosynthesis
MPSPAVDSVRRGELLILESDIEGHSQEWLQHLVEFVAAGGATHRICVVAPPALCAALSHHLPAGGGDRVRLMAMTRREQRMCSHRVLTIAAFARWWTMRRYLQLSGAAGGFFLSLDLLCLPLGLGLGAQGKPLAGILFRPSVHYAAMGGYRPTVGERLRDVRKSLFYRLMLRNPAVRTVLSLDPFFPDHAVAHYPEGVKVRALPDPAEPPGDATESTRTVHDFVPAERVGLLLFGYLTARKGPLAVLEALALLPDPIARRIAVLFAGRVDPAIRNDMDRRIASLAREKPELWLRVEDRRLDRDELEALVTRSDVVLAPYQRFVGSSGVLLWAARAGRPVLAQDYGLIGRLIRDHRLGVAVDTSDPARLAAEIGRVVERGPQSFIDRPSAARFVASRAPQDFASLVFSSTHPVIAP